MDPAKDFEGAMYPGLMKGMTVLLLEGRFCSMDDMYEIASRSVGC